MLISAKNVVLANKLCTNMANLVCKTALQTTAIDGGGGGRS